MVNYICTKCGVWRDCHKLAIAADESYCKPQCSVTNRRYSMCLKIKSNSAQVDTLH